ncbi:hypothetical protein GTP44_05650 [Duganella sp. FT50W]|uniref:Uncharacterized protein n=1 Tax=Duganella lactea TaxID=2692173 RepID=A0A6L8MI41_9BURK|nr:hypothetical protein [Duganella lactea]MYM36416.1 hypothetical protein [Duganella lactea]MYM81436.1 hypothetical protein [Duganella lactea]
MITQQHARELLDQIETTEQRSQYYLGYWRYAIYVQLWGVIWIVAHLANYALPGHAGTIWAIADAIGIALTIAGRLRQQERTGGERRLLWGALILAAFGMMVTMLIGGRPQAIEVFWTCLVMTVYMLYGLWAGPRWTVLGLLVSLVSLATYFYLRPWFDLVMAFAAGGGLLLGGFWLRRAA